jgi:acetyl esterase/lipase
MARGFAREGFAVYSVEFCGIEEVGGVYPDTYVDIGSALDLIRSLRKRARLDLSRVMGIGHIAGTLLILWAARVNFDV